MSIQLHNFSVHYLAQCKSENVDRIKAIVPKHNKLTILTWDKKVNGCFYLPESSWSEGRNHLFENSKHDTESTYFIFLDDDVEFEQGNFLDFELFLRDFNPSIGVPVMQKSKKFVSIIKFFFEKSKNTSVCFRMDEQVQAFSRNVVFDGVALPYPTLFDKECWWYNTELHQSNVKSVYFNSILQCNDVVVLNHEHANYPRDFSKFRMSEIGSMFFYKLRISKRFMFWGYGIFWRFVAYRTYFLDLLFYFHPVSSDKKIRQKKWFLNTKKTILSRILSFNKELEK